jgi:CheY-like chemotaxis protein
MTHSILQKILHVDDDTVMRMMVKKALERSQKGFDVVSCASAHEFLDKITPFSPDLLIIDVIMPIMTGPVLLEKVRGLSIKTPAVFMTGQEMVEIQNREKMEPILGIIQKPFSPASLGDDLIKLWNGFSD